MRPRFLILCAVVLAPIAARAAPLDVVIDDAAARAVLKAVQSPDLTRDQALAVAKLPGNEGLIEKLHSYNKPATEEMLAEALIAASRGQPVPGDDDYGFAKVRENAVQIERTLDQLADASTHLIDGVKARIAVFTPARVKGRVIGYLIAGGTSGGFSFGKPEFFLNIYRFPSPLMAQTILKHELYHGVQGLALGDWPPTAVKACLAKLSGGEHLSEFLKDVYDEGTASYVGDVLTMPPGNDPTIEEERKHLLRNVAQVKRSVTLLELSVHAITTSSIDYDQIYALGFYGDEILYALGYVMAKAIATERGPQAMADLLGQPASRFITTYIALPGYGRGKDEPKLGDETIAWSKKAATCGA